MRRAPRWRLVCDDGLACVRVRVCVCCWAGVDIETGKPKDLWATEGITDLYSTKWWAIKLATDAAVTILRVDQIIMSKQAGGPKPRGPGGDDD